MAPTGTVKGSDSKKSAGEHSEVTRITTDMIKPFDGSGDVVAWIKKVKLVAKLKGVEDLCSLLPLYLEGDALALYLEMEDSDQLDIACIETKLKTAFSDDNYEAYAKLIRKKWLGESVDVYMNEIRRLAGLAGFDGKSLDNIVKLAFVTGLPHDMGIAIQQMDNVATVTTSEMLARARVLVANDVRDVTASAQSDTRKNIEKDYGGKREMHSYTTNFKLKCFNCGGPHMARNCKERSSNITCFNCGKIGHIAAQCYEQGNRQKVVGAPAATR